MRRTIPKVRRKGLCGRAKPFYYALRADFAVMRQGSALDPY